MIKSIQTFVLLLLCFGASAQKIFSEGVIKYNVYINGEKKPSGVYIIWVKNGNLRRELSMQNGYSNVTLYNHKDAKTYSLNIHAENKYVLALTKEEIEESNKQFENAQYILMDKKLKIASYSCVGNQIVYQNQDTIEVFYTDEMVLQYKNMNAMFPEINGLPLMYELKKNATITMLFKADVIEEKPLEDLLFTVPSEYKIVSKKELNEIE
ncbi:MAG: hypothetical protein R2831_08055 [Chitinophagaceae bacterium]